MAYLGLSSSMLLASLALAPAAHATAGSDWLPLTGGDIEVGCTWDNGCTLDGVPGYHTAGAKALDLIVPVDRPVHASGAGTIVDARGVCGPGTGPPPCHAGDGRGNYLTIDHGSHFSRYLHLSSIVVSSGPVEAGQLIARTGRSGHNSGAHLHYDELTNPVSGTGKLDPGTLKACHGSTVASYPGAGGWPGIAAFTTSLRNDGYGCIAPPKPSCTSLVRSVGQDAPTVIQLSCSGESISYSPPSAPPHGTISSFDASAGTLTYTPAAGYTGQDSFTFGASNAGGESDRATASIVVVPHKPSCVPVTEIVTIDTPAAVQLSCSGQALSYSAPSAPEHGTISGFNAVAGTLTYTPAPGYTGPDSFTFGASNAGGDADRAMASITISAPPTITNLRARSRCVASARLQGGTPTGGTHGLAFSYTLDQPSEVLYLIYRRDGSPHRRRCPQSVGGHSQDTFTPVGSLGGSGSQGENAVVLAGAASTRRATARRPQLRQRAVRAGRQRISLAQITAGRALQPGTYLLFVSATNALGQQSELARAKFFVLAPRPSTTQRSAR